MKSEQRMAPITADREKYLWEMIQAIQVEYHKQIKPYIDQLAQLHALAYKPPPIIVSKEEAEQMLKGRWETMTKAITTPR